MFYSVVQRSIVSLRRCATQHCVLHVPMSASAEGSSNDNGSPSDRAAPGRARRTTRVAGAARERGAEMRARVKELATAATKCGPRATTSVRDAPTTDTKSIRLPKLAQCGPSWTPKLGQETAAPGAPMRRRRCRAPCGTLRSGPMSRGRRNRSSTPLRN